MGMRSREIADYAAPARARGAFPRALPPALRPPEPPIPGVTLHAAVLDDVDEILRFWSLAAENTDRPADRPEAVQALIARDPAALLLVVHEAMIVGCVVHAIWSAAGYSRQDSWSRSVKRLDRSPAGEPGVRSALMRDASFCISPASMGGMTKAITVRLDEADHAALARQAEQLRVQPGTLARMLVHASLAEDQRAQPDARAAIARLVRRSQRRPAADAVALVNEARAALGAQG